MLKTLSPGDMGCAYGLKIVLVVVEKGRRHTSYISDQGGERNRQQTNNLYEGVNVGKAKKKNGTMGERKRSKHHKTIPKKKKKHILPATGHTGVCYLFFFFFWLGSTQNNFLFYVTKTKNKKSFSIDFFFLRARFLLIYLTRFGYPCWYV